jgi:hypothetical protein
MGSNRLDDPAEAADAREEASRAESKFTAQCRNQVNTCAIVILLT